MNYTKFKKEWEAKRQLEAEAEQDKVYASILNEIGVVRL